MPHPFTRPLVRPLVRPPWRGAPADDDALTPLTIDRTDIRIDRMDITLDQPTA